ncbi:MAG: DUF4955 domain-containing protein [Flavicella sp.]
MKYNNILKKCIAFVLLTYSTFSYGQSNPSNLVKDWIIAQENGTEPILPNFSYAGYHNGEIALPSSFTQTVYDVTDPAYGAVANDGNSDKSAIIAAIAAAESNPNGGIIFFPPGEFHINETTDNLNQIIRISKSNIVIKGSGSGTGGTTLIQNSYTNPSNPLQFWTSPYLFQFKPTNTTRSHITSIVSNATRETFEVEVADASGIVPGQWVRLVLADDDPNLLQEEFAPYAVVSSYTKIGTEVNTWEIHKVASVAGTTVTFVEPIHKTINSNYNWSLETFPVIEEVGMQDLNYKGGMTTTFVHHSGWQQDSGWSGVEFNQVANGWIKNVEFSEMSNAAQFKLTAYSSAIQNRYTGNPGHAFISANAATGCLIGLNTDLTSGILHGCGVNGPSIGNVLWRNSHPTNGNSGTEIHASQPRVNLIDACSGGMGMHYGGGVSSQPNHLRHLVLWNFEGKGYTNTNFEFWKKNQTYGKIIPPIVSGLVGFSISEDTSQSISGTDKQYQINESPGSHVDEHSLYETQLTHRLGTIPSWINTAITLENFDNTKISGWSTETYKGNANISWTLDAKNTSGYINNTKQIYMQSGKKGLKSGTITGGIGSFSVECKDLWSTGNQRKIRLFINGQRIATKKHTGTEVYTFNVNNINIEGEFTLEIKNISSRTADNTVAIDNVSWTSYAPIHPIAVETASSKNVKVGDTLTLTKTVYPYNAIDKTVTWTSSDTNIATIDANGFVTAVSTGVAQMTVSTNDGNYTDVCAVNVGKTETFTNNPLNGWTTDSFVGDHNVEWTLDAKSLTGYMDGKHIYMRSGKTGITSETIQGGISSFSVECKDLWGAGEERNIELLINGNVVASLTHIGTEVYHFEANNINISGAIQIALRNASTTDTNKSIAIDNMYWSPYNATSNKSWKKNSSTTEASITKGHEVYPNPFKDSFNLLLSEDTATITLYNTSGAIIYQSQSEGKKEIEIQPSLTSIPKGVYFLKVSNSKETKTLKILKI